MAEINFEECREDVRELMIELRRSEPGNVLLFTLTSCSKHSHVNISWTELLALAVGKLTHAKFNEYQLLFETNHYF